MEQTAGKPGAGATTSEGKTLCFWAPANIICLYITLHTHLYTLISGVLANFFNSLLSKKTGGMAGAGQVFYTIQAS